MNNSIILDGDSMKETNKREIVKMLLNQDIDKQSEEELLDMLVDNPISVDVDKMDEENMTIGDRIADKLTAIAGSWNFIIGFSLFLIAWIVINGVILTKALDPFPFILLNLLLSCIAALQAPVIMMSQNRQAKKDSLRNKNDYKTDLKTELIIEELHDKIDEILRRQKELEKQVKELKNKE